LPGSALRPRAYDRVVMPTPSVAEAAGPGGSLRALRLRATSAPAHTLVGRAAVACALIAVVAGCGAGATDTPARLPASGVAYRALSADGRVAVARSCRDRAAARARGAAARQLRAVDPRALSGQLDDAFTAIALQRRPVAAVCARLLPFVTPGLSVSFAGAKRERPDHFTYETTSDKRLTIRGQIAPAPPRGRVVARRETGAPGAYRAAIGADGRFVIPRLHLRKIADNTFTVAIDAPPNALRKVHFSAICLDCLAGAPPPGAPR
jgi:hypothetical protein